LSLRLWIAETLFVTRKRIKGDISGRLSYGFSVFLGSDVDTLANDKISDLLTDKCCKIGTDHFVHVAVSDYESVAVGDCDSGYGVTELWGNRWSLERTEMEEYHDLGCSYKFA